MCEQTTHFTALRPKTCVLFCTCLQPCLGRGPLGRPAAIQGVGASLGSLAGLCWGQAVQGVPAGSPSPQDPMGGEAPRAGQLGLAFYHHSRLTPLLSEHAVSLASSGGRREGEAREGQRHRSSSPLRVGGAGRGHITLGVRAGSQAPRHRGGRLKKLLPGAGCPFCSSQSWDQDPGPGGPAERFLQPEIPLEGVMGTQTPRGGHVFIYNNVALMHT